MGIADKDYFLDAEGQLTDSEEKAATLLLRAGQDVPVEMADKYGIGKVAQADEAADPVSAKAATPSANKKASPSKNKGVKNK